ncbi:MAG: hypothetical protein HQL37_01640 [Alphaproteobacteria bacterium]|nr:hypothetical protein [Alphaproteobacteria bacterium]
MPVEIRRIVFSIPEFQQVLANHASQDTAVKCTALSYRLVSQTPIKIEMVFQGQDGHIYKYSIDDDFATAAMVEYCLLAQIPMSKDARKAAHFLSDSKAAFDMVLRETTMVAAIHPGRD